MKLHVLFTVLNQPISLPKTDGPPIFHTGAQYGVFYSRDLALLYADKLRGKVQGRLFIQEIDVEPTGEIPLTRAAPEGRP